MPIIALFDFNDLTTSALDSAPLDGTQTGIYLDGATSVDGRALLDGINDKVKIYADNAYQLDRGTLEIQFAQTAHTGCDANTLLSRDSIGETAGGFHIDVMPDGSINVVHEGAGTTETYTTGAGFAALGDEINLTYSWDVASGGALVVHNLTAGTTYDAPVPAGLTMDMGPINQPWIIGAGQSLSKPAILNDINQYFHGSVELFSISNSVDNLDQDPNPQPDIAVTDEDTPVVIDVLGNDTDPQGQPVSVSGTPTAPHGTVTVNPDG
ncbi:MAG: Ig-like domain-containing protein, partial [Paracoccaceae bacterium]|nr:Ig-like domain-containing protein [Paracoccaceae bacterium]